MCGLSGILYKNSGALSLAPVGEDLVKMLESMTHRGKDSSGITVVGGGPGCRPGAPDLDREYF